jgi:hypothetical protein
MMTMKKMKLLFENWRGYLLNEGMKTVDDLPEGVYIAIKKTQGGFSVYYSDKDGRRTPPTRAGQEVVVPHGKIMFGPTDQNIDGNCLNAFVVFGSKADNRWGPLLYDIAIEWATERGSGLIADRGIVSPEARAVWDYYLNKRSDVYAVQLDDKDPDIRPDRPSMNKDNYRLTPGKPEDDCDQQVALSDPGGYPEYDRFDPPEPDEWKAMLRAAPLSKMYRKEPTTINKLREMGRLLEL